MKEIQKNSGMGGLMLFFFLRVRCTAGGFVVLHRAFKFHGRRTPPT